MADKSGLLKNKDYLAWVGETAVYSFNSAQSLSLSF